MLNPRARSDDLCALLISLNVETRFLTDPESGCTEPADADKSEAASVLVFSVFFIVSFQFVGLSDLSVRPKVILHIAYACGTSLGLQIF